ncbi:MAG: hypothetical protein EOM51_09105 [Clostridia bacterium]|nr:hypothetical protein [Clostridia bacterium]
MKTVYVDEMFLLNLIIDYFIVLATAKLCALPLKRLRFALSAALGALYSVLLLYKPFSLLASPLIKLPLGFVMTILAFGLEIRPIKPYLAFLVVSAAFGGAVYAATLLAGRSLGDGFYINASMRVLVLSFAACYLVLTLVFRRFGRHREREIRSVSVSFCGKTAEFKALRDTGNELYDPLSGLPVMVLDVNEANKLLPQPLIEALRRGVSEFIETVGSSEDFRTRFRLVPYSCVGVKMALLPVFRPDGLFVDGKERKNTLVGLSSNILSNNSDYSAIL